MNSCHEEGVRDRNRAGIEAADPAREHPPRDMSSSETEHCYGGIDARDISVGISWSVDRPNQGRQPPSEVKTTAFAKANTREWGEQFLMNSCHEEGVRDRNRAGIEATDPLFR
eukprot:gene25112-biopygen10414